MSGDSKSLWPFKGDMRKAEMNKNINPLFSKIIPFLCPAAVSEVTSCKSHNKSAHHKLDWGKRPPNATSCQIE